MSSRPEPDQQAAVHVDAKLNHSKIPAPSTHLKGAVIRSYGNLYNEI